MLSVVKHEGSRLVLRVDKLNGKLQGRVGELVPRNSFNVIRGSGPGRHRVLEVTQMDGPDFSLCAVSLKLSDPVFRSGMVRTTIGGMEVQSNPDQRETEKT